MADSLVTALRADDSVVPVLTNQGFLASFLSGVFYAPFEQTHGLLLN